MKENKGNDVREKIRAARMNAPAVQKAKNVNDYYSTFESDKSKIEQKSKKKNRGDKNTIDKYITSTFTKADPKDIVVGKNKKRIKKSGDLGSSSEILNDKKTSKASENKISNGNKKTDSKKKQGKKNSNYQGATEPVKIISLGGLYEIGKNLTIFEYKDQIIILDCGMSFPEDDMFGIDIVIPDFTYLEDNKEKILGLFLTHGHEDHIGAVPYLLKKIDVPIYATKFPMGLIKNKLREHKLDATLNEISPGDVIRVGDFTVEAIRTTHSIPDCLCYLIETPVASFFHTGDFKIDYTPVDGQILDFAKLADISRKGVTVMFADSTNATKAGFCSSERTVANELDSLINQSRGRLLIATFSSNLHRIQGIVNSAATHGRKVAISGRSMENVVDLGKSIGYLHAEAGVIIDIKDIDKYPDNEVVIITTGSQGEPLSALSRMAANEHRSVKLRKGDTVIFSSSPVPGNEKTVSNIMNKLFEKDVKVIYSEIAPVHVSGHANREELKIIHSIIKPKFFVPVHGECRHLIAHAELAESLGMDRKNIFIADNGDRLSVTRNSVKQEKNVIPSEPILIDGLGVGDVGNTVLNERRRLSEAGLIVVTASIDKANGLIMSGPEILTRGFVYVKDNEELVEEARELAAESLENILRGNEKDWNTIINTVRDDLRKFIFKRTKKTPMILTTFLDF